MASQILADLATEVTRDTDVKSSAAKLINGFAQRLTDAIAAAVSNGATAEELAPVQEQVNAMRAGSDELSAAVAANTPAEPPPSQSRR